MMVLPLAVVAAAALSMGTTADTTIAAHPGMSLQIATFAGDVTVSAWEKDAVRVESSDPEQERFRVKAANGKILVRTDESWSHGRSVDLKLFVPAWMNLDISGVNTDVQITGTRGRVRVETINGDIVVKGGRGQIELSAVTQDISLTDASGTVVSQTVNGDLTFQRIASDSVEASTVNGGIFYEGTIRDRGVYRFTSHDGDVAVALPKTANATVSVSTFSGEFASDFPVSVSESRPGRRFCFSLGRGSAKVELESFQGTIHLFRPGALKAEIEVERDTEKIKARAEKVR
jgi:DUF4097 and DUF4098 domain-containing protein YvlB